MPAKRPNRENQTLVEPALTAETAIGQVEVEYNHTKTPRFYFPNPPGSPKNLTTLAQLDYVISLFKYFQLPLPADVLIDGQDQVSFFANRRGHFVSRTEPFSILLDWGYDSDSQVEHGDADLALVLDGISRVLNDTFTPELAMGRLYAYLFTLNPRNTGVSLQQLLDKFVSKFSGPEQASRTAWAGLPSYPPL